MARRSDNRFEDVSSFSSKSEYRKSRKAKKRRHKGVKVFFSIVFVLLIICGAGLIYVSNYLLGDLTTKQITKDKGMLGIVSDVTTDPKITNIALFGVDARDDVFEGRSDVIMVLTLDEIHNSVKMTSILRDSRVFISDNYEGTDTGWDKITHAYFFEGPEGAIRTINQNFKLDITDYITVNFSNMSKIVDAFDGIDVEITYDEMEQVNINLHNLALEEGDETTISDEDYLDSDGLVHMTGNAAVAFCRIRNIDSDTFRAGRQQLVMEALAKRAQEINVSEYPKLIKELTGFCETSLSLSKMMSFIPFALEDFDVQRIIVPGEEEYPDTGNYENGLWMWDYDLDNAANHIRNFIYETGESDTGDSGDEDTDGYTDDYSDDYTEEDTDYDMDY